MSNRSLGTRGSSIARSRRMLGRLALGIVWFSNLSSGFGWQLTDDTIGVQVPDGMVIEKVAADEMATNIFCMTIDANGVTVVSGPGYVKKLIDTDGDGFIDNVVEFSNRPSSGAQGMYFENADLICTGDGGLLRFKDTNQDDVADGPPEQLLPLKTGGEHMAHAVRRGPDGWLYVLCGNRVSPRPEYFNGPNSPVKNPESGFLMRISPDFVTREIVSHGFRNAYDFDFNSEGGIFVYDSDGERDISLPWYRPTRVFQVRAGDHAGWISTGWKRPGYFFDMPQVVGALGRGSPTGVCCYQHDRLGSEYVNAIFVADWTFGRIIVFKQDTDGNYDGGNDFAVSKGHFGFAITDLEVAPEGSLLVSVGGRGTEGGVYRISKLATGEMTEVPGTSDEGRVAGAKLPFSSWGRARGSSDGLIWSRWEVLQAEKTDPERILLVQQITNAVGGAPLSVLQEALEQGLDDGLSAALVRSVSRIAWDRLTIQQINKALIAPGEETRIAALESLVGRRDFIGDLDVVTKQDFFSSLRTILADPDVKTSRLLFNTIRSWPDDLAAEFPGDGFSNRSSILIQVAKAREVPDRVNAFHACMALLSTSNNDHGLTIRLAQLTMGGCGPTPGNPTVFDGYSPRIELPIKASEGPDFQVLPASTRDDNEEYRRLSSMLARNGREMFSPSELAEHSDEFGVDEDITWLIQVARTGKTVPPKMAAKKLLGLGEKVARAGEDIDRNWYPRLSELAKQVFENQPQIIQAILDDHTYGKNTHPFLHRAMPGPLKADSAIVFQETIRNDLVHATVDQVRIAATAKIHDPALFRRCVDHDHLVDEAIIALAKHPLEEDHRLFLDGLDSFNPATVKCSVVSLRRLAESGVSENIQSTELARCLSTASRLGWDKQGVSIRDQIVMLMRKITGQSFGYEMKANKKIQTDVLTQWRTYLSNRYPGQFDSAEDVLDFEKTFARVDWSKGDRIRGLALYRKQQCALCHDGGTSLGPRLTGVTNRFSNRDVFRSIAMPSEQVPARYRAMIVETVDGLIVKGAVIYESVDGITLLEPTGKTIRINQTDIESKTMSSHSLMPSGLLDRLDEQGWADLSAYLKTL